MGKIVLLEERAAEVTTDSHVFIYYAGHGSREGLALGNETVTPGELYKTMAGLRGKKVIILDSCHAGIFLSRKYKIPENTLIIAASATDQKAYEKATTRVFGQRRGVFTRALIEYCEENPRSFELAGIARYIKEKIARGEFYLEQSAPIVGDGQFTLRTIYIPTGLVGH